MKLFRFSSYLFVAVLCLGLVSCSDDDDPTFEESQILGAWTVVTEEGYYHNENGKKITETNDYTNGEWVFIFGEDNTGVEVEDRKYYDLFDWSFKNGNQLIFDYDGYEQPNKILQLNSSICIVETTGKGDFGKYYTKTTLKRYIAPE